MDADRVRPVDDPEEHADEARCGEGIGIGGGHPLHSGSSCGRHREAGVGHLGNFGSFRRKQGGVRVREPKSGIIFFRAALEGVAGRLGCKKPMALARGTSPRLPRGPLKTWMNGFFARELRGLSSLKPPPPLTASPERLRRSDERKSYDVAVRTRSEAAWLVLLAIRAARTALAAVLTAVSGVKKQPGA